jgi:hypothetical protein
MKAEKTGSGNRWRMGGLIALLALMAGLAVWMGLRKGGEPPPKAPVVCLACGYTGTVVVGDAPGQEEWPRECPKCHAKRLYMSRPCPYCGRPLPFKDPKAEKFGEPSECPACKRNVRGS